MNDLPKGWVETTLGEVADTQLGKMLSKKSRTGVGERPYLRNRNVQWFRFDLDDLAVMDFTDAEVDKFRIEPGDVLVCEGGEVGRAAIWTDPSTEMLYQKAVHRVRASEAIEPRLIPYYLRWMQDRRAFDKHTTGVTIGHLPQEDLRVLELPLPPINEQRRLISAIEEQLSRLDGVVRELLRSKERLCAHDAFQRPCEDAPVTLASILKEPLVNGRSVRDRPGGYPVLRLTAMKGRHIDLTERKCGDWDAEQGRRFRIQLDDFFVARGNGSLSLVGRGVLVERDDEVAFPDTMIRIRVDPDVADARFVRVVWNSRFVRNQIERIARTTAGIYKINQRDIEQVLLPLPPLEDQKRIVAEVERQLSILDSVKITVDHALVRCGQLRRSILERAFTGRLVPQDPDDEPAEVLLERIRAERATSPKPGRANKPRAGGIPST